MDEFCKDDIPRLCDHSLLRNSSRHTRPCSLAESYVSSGRDLTLEHILQQGSALYPISFVLQYEFVHESMSCNQVFTSLYEDSSSSTLQHSYFTSLSSSPLSKSIKFSSPKSVFFYGRGGTQNLSCVYKFETPAEQKVELSILRASFGNKHCKSYIDPLVDRWACNSNERSLGKDGIAELQVNYQHLII